MQSTDTRVFDSFTRVFVTHTREHEILASLLAGISNTLQVLTTRYEFTREFFTFIIPPEVNILQGWLSLSPNYSKQSGKSVTSFHALCA